MKIRVDDLTGPEIRQLLEEHLQHMRSLSPPESVHALDLDALRRPEITFWTIWSDDSKLMGSGALKSLGDGHGEIKSMRTADAHRLYTRTGFTPCGAFANYPEDPFSLFMTMEL